MTTSLRHFLSRNFGQNKESRHTKRLLTFMNSALCRTQTQSSKPRELKYSTSLPYRRNTTENQLLKTFTESRRLYFGHFKSIITLPIQPLYTNSNWSMRYERNRLRSFDGVSETQIFCKSPVSLARTGFYFDHRLNALFCFSCGGVNLSHDEYCNIQEENLPFHRIPSPPPARFLQNPQSLNVAQRSTSMVATKTIATAHSSRAPDCSSRLSLIQSEASQLDHSPSNGMRQVPGSTDDAAESNVSSYGGHQHQQKFCSDSLETESAKIPESDKLCNPETQVSETQQRMCRCCRRQPASVTFRPCGHSILCHTCAVDQQVCVLCGKGHRR